MRIFTYSSLQIWVFRNRSFTFSHKNVFSFLSQQKKRFFFYFLSLHTQKHAFSVPTPKKNAISSLFLLFLSFLFIFAFFPRVASPFPYAATTKQPFPELNPIFASFFLPFPKFLKARQINKLACLPPFRVFVWVAKQSGKQ